MKRVSPLVALLLLVAVPGASALSFLEDFEGFGLGGFNPVTKPDQDWYTYAESSDIGEVTATDPLNGAQSFRVASATGSKNTASFALAGPTQLTNLTFTVKGATQSEGGSRQFVQIQSQAPHRTLAEFYVFCTDSSAPDACELRVRFEQVDSKGQVLINTTVGDDTFTVTLLPDWTTGTYQLFVNGVDDGVFPFLELPTNIGRLRIVQDSSVFAMNATLDDWFIDGAIEAPTGPDRDIAQGLKNFANDTHFTTPASLFILGLVFLGILLAAVMSSAFALGKDNTILPAISFFGGLCVVWLVVMEWWPDWINVVLIILTAAQVGLFVRQKIMGIKDASTNGGLVAGSLGYFIIASTLLAMAGYGGVDLELPSGVLETEEDQNETSEKQGYVGAIAECTGNIITLGLLDMDCSRETKGSTWAKIENFASTVFNFARTAFTFLFQLLTLRLPIPTVFNAMIVLPPAGALATVGLGFITRVGS